MTAVVAGPVETQVRLIHRLKGHGIAVLGATGTPQGAGELAQQVAADMIVLEPAQAPRPGLGALRRRELEVLELMGRGYSNDDIAGSLHISLHTVKRHVENLLCKLDIHGQHSRLRAAVLAAQAGLI